eukprot:jgi/Astpho2/6713/Aster-x1395
MPLLKQTTLSKQCSNVYKMSLDEFQLSVGSGKPFGSMNMDEFLQTVWDREPSLLSLGDMEGELEPSRRELRQLPSFNSAGSFSLPEDFSGKTVDEVWAAIKRNQADVRQPQSDHFTVGGLLEGIGVIPGEEGAAGQPQQQMAGAPFGVKLEHHHLPAVPPLELHGFSQSPAQQQQQQPLQLDIAGAQEQDQSIDSSGEFQKPAAGATHQRTQAPARQMQGSRGKGGRLGGSQASHQLCAGYRLGSPAQRGSIGNSPSSLKSLPQEVHFEGSIEKPPPPKPRQRKRKEIDVVDDKTLRLQKRMMKKRPISVPNTCPATFIPLNPAAEEALHLVKNRESAARSRQRKQAYTSELEEKVEQLQQQNADLLQKVIQCSPPPNPNQSAPAEASQLRRSRSSQF